MRLIDDEMGKLVDSQLLDLYFSENGSAPVGYIQNLYNFFCLRVNERFSLARTQLRLGEMDVFKKHLHVLQNSFLNVGARQMANACQQLDSRMQKLTRHQILNCLDIFEEKAEMVRQELQDLIQSRL